MRVLILGASGLIGGNLLREMKKDGKYDVVGTYFTYQAKDCVFYNTLNEKDESNFNVQSFSPELIVHCGALTWVDYCEENEEESFEKTVTSTQNALKLASDCRAKFVYLSTDYVFDGKTGPYTEEDEINPISVYGKHKLEAENLVRKSDTGYIIGRVTNVYGDEERGKNFISRLVKTAESGEKSEMDFPYDQYATPVNARDVSKALIKLIEHNKSGIYNLASTDYVNRYQLASMVLKQFPENNITVNAVSTESMNQKALRPLYGGLLSIKFLNEFPNFEFSNVCDYIKELKER